MNTWLNARIQASAHDDITFLRSPQGFDSFLQLIHQKNLPDRIIEQLVKLLVRQKFRTSFLREDTDKAYHALLGSEFLTSLHAHVRCSVPMAAARVEPYVQFCEELMKRCSDGWKEAPLDELRRLVEDMEGGNDLRYAVDRLLQQRSKEKRMMSGGSEAGGPSSTDFGFRRFPIGMNAPTDTSTLWANPGDPWRRPAAPNATPRLAEQITVRRTAIHTPESTAARTQFTATSVSSPSIDSSIDRIRPPPGLRYHGGPPADLLNPWSYSNSDVPRRTTHPSFHTARPNPWPAGFIMPFPP